MRDSRPQAFCNPPHPVPPPQGGRGRCGVRPASFRPQPSFEAGARRPAGHRRPCVPGRRRGRVGLGAAGAVVAGPRRGALRHRARPQRPAAPGLRGAGRPLAAAGRGEGRGPALPRHAHRLRGQALPQPRGRRLWALLRAGWQLVRHQRIVSGGSTITMQVARLLLGEPRAHAVGQDQADAAGAVARAALLQGRDPAPLPAARALRRQPRGRARGLARLFRQGAAPALRRRGGAARGDPAVARGAPPRPLPRRRPARPRPRARPHAGGRRRLGEDAARPWPSAMPPPSLARREFPMLGAASGRRRGGPARRPHRPPPDPRPRVPGRARGAGARLRGDAGGPRCRRRSSSSITAPARSSPTSARRGCSNGARRRHRHDDARCARRARR